MALNFIHISDTHLGFTDLDIQNSTGKNVREDDVYRAFSDAVDFILELKPDFVIHSGDILHRASPTNRAIINAANQIQRITDTGIQFYMIAGNHDFPKSVFTSSIHDIFLTNDLVRIAFDEKLEVIETEDYILHLLPHINGEEKFFEEIEKIKIVDKKKPNILSMHVAISKYAMEEFGERIFPFEKIKILKGFDYVALGHWHRFNHLKKFGNVFYSGSTERTSDTQTGYDKGFLIVTIDKDKGTKTEFVPLNLRRYEKITIDNCNLKSEDEIISEITDEAKKGKIKGGIFHVLLKDIPSERANNIPRLEFEQIFKDALYFRIAKNILGSSEYVEIDSESFDLRDFFLDELSAVFKGNELKKVKDLSMRFWDEIEEEEADADS